MNLKEKEKEKRRKIQKSCDKVGAKTRYPSSSLRTTSLLRPVSSSGQHREEKIGQFKTRNVEVEIGEINDNCVKINDKINDKMNDNRDYHTTSLREILVEDTVEILSRGLVRLFSNQRNGTDIYDDEYDNDDDNSNDIDENENDYEGGKAIENSPTSSLFSTSSTTSTSFPTQSTSISTSNISYYNTTTDIQQSVHTQEPMLPCEFCAELISLTILSAHQIECGLSSGAIRRNRRELFMPRIIAERNVEHILDNRRRGV